MSINYSKIPSPCYVLDEHLLKRNLELIQNVQKEADIKIILAFKGFSMWSTFPLVKQYISATAASSVYEARLAVEEMGCEAHTYSPAYTEKDFAEIIKYSSHITFNSLSQFERFYPLVKASGKKISVGLRVNPEYSEVSTDLYNPCAAGTRLGVLAEELCDSLPEGIEGLHFHALCESSSYTLENTLKSFTQKFDKLIRQAKWINMGGGHLMTRKDYDVNHLVSLLQNFKKEYNVEVILEPGSAFAWETGVLVSSIVDIVENKGIKTAILDVSFTAHMPDCLEMPYQPRILGSVEETPQTYAYRMGGNSCLAGDYIGYWYFEKPLNIGDKIVFDDMIHYTMVKTTMFNGVAHPSIGIWNDLSGFRLVREFHYEDYKKRLS